ncbi:MAG: hypothetical protein B6U85_03875 [Desulfurococcales archaeon ex4484_42]|nr:MAG: hypothetical protein B6U85_03875 [Desulfurococcales archaeon ex4484_42]
MPIDFTSPLTWFYLLLTALIPGLLATWLGVGGCFLRIPMLMYLFGIPIKVAYAINQAVVALTTVPGVIVHLREKHVYIKGLINASLSAMVGVSLGAYVVAKYIPAQHLRVFFGFVCVAIGIYVIRSTLKARATLVKRVTVEAVKVLEHGLRLSLLMFVAGFATGLCGFGGGIYFVPTYMALGYPTHVAIGTSSTQMLPVAGLGSAVLTASGFMDPLMLIAVGIPTLLASWIGAKLATKSPPWFLRVIYGASIIGAGLYVALDTLVKLYLTS